MLGSGAVNFNNPSYNSNGNYVGMGDPANLDFERTDAWTTAFWVRGAGGTGTTNYDDALVSKMPNTNPDIYRGYEIHVGTDGHYSEAANNKKLTIWLINTYGSNFIQVDGSVNVLTGDWVHVAVTYDGSSDASGVEMYINGVRDTGRHETADSLTGSILNDKAFSLGSRNGAFHGFTGDLDEVAVWNEELGAEKIALINGLARFSGVTLNDPAIDNVLGVFNAGSGMATAGDDKWAYASGLGSTIIGTTGGSIAGGNAWIVLDSSGHGVILIPEPTTAILAGLGLAGLGLRRRRPGARGLRA